MRKTVMLYLWIGDFRVSFCLCFKARPSAKPFIWKLVLFTHKFWFICMSIKLITIWKASHQDSLWNRGERQLGNCLFYSSCESTIEVPYVVPGFVVVWQRPVQSEGRWWLEGPLHAEGRLKVPMEASTCSKICFHMVSHSVPSVSYFFYGLM